MKIFFTSDTHFSHSNVIKYCNRPWQTVDEMDAGLIANWNATVGPDDHVYHLGDLAFKRNRSLTELVNKLNGTIYLVEGNHDKNFSAHLKARFAWIKPYYELRVPFENSSADAPSFDQVIVLCHYPIESWNLRHHGSWHLHGHCHGSMPSPIHQARLDVGVDVHNWKPVSLEEIQLHMVTKRFKPVDHHGAII